MTPPKQDYVSDELSHFVGRGMKSEEQQYQLLVDIILKSGWLTYAPHDPSKPRSASLDYSKPISTDETISYQVVCFCDIPISSLGIHTKKYSRFGLAFKKEFLVARGACPVFYVENSGPVPEERLFSPDDFLDRIKIFQQLGYVDRAIFFDTSVRAIMDVLTGLDILCSDGSNRYFIASNLDDDFRGRLEKLMGLTSSQIAAAESVLKGSPDAKIAVRLISNFLMSYVFTFMKCFHSSHPLDHPDNYYMEREWRLGNNLKFDLRDVARVFLPAAYMSRLRTDLPDYSGEVTVLA